MYSIKAKEEVNDLIEKLKVQFKLSSTDAIKQVEEAVEDIERENFEKEMGWSK